MCPHLNHCRPLINFRHWVGTNSQIIKSIWSDLYLVGERLIEFEFDAGVCYSLKVKVTLFFYRLRIFNLSTVIRRQILHYELLVLMVHRSREHPQ